MTLVRTWIVLAAIVSALLFPLQGAAQSIDASKTIRSTELRADKMPSAAVITSIPAGASLQLLRVEGDWVLVNFGKQRGWVRANSLPTPIVMPKISSFATDRETPEKKTVVSTAQSIPAKSSRHALIISISRFADPKTASLPGAAADKESATEIAHAMQIPDANITYLQDEQATGENIRKAIRDLNQRVQEGDRVFLHYSGHGTRFKDPTTGNCAEALSTFDGGVWNGMVTNKEMAKLLAPLTQKTDKMFVMYDACYSGGLLGNSSPVPERSFSNLNDEGGLRGRFNETSEECAKPTNVRDRSLVDEAVSNGVFSDDIVFLSAARNNELSLEDMQKGGLATQFVRDCMLRDAVDLDGSGAISMEEIQICAQKKIYDRMANVALFTPQHILLSGNRGFVPAWFSQALPNKQVPGKPSTGVLNTVAQTQSDQKPIASPPPNLTGAQALHQMFDQRDAKRRVQVVLGKNKVRIGHDKMDLSVQSDRGGYVYVALAGSDNQSLYMLFPNALDQNNRINKGEQLLLPRPSWPVVPAGPIGLDTLLVMVTDSPRDLNQLSKEKGSPFSMSLNDSNGRASLGALMTNSQLGVQASCRQSNARSSVPCSDSYGADLVSIEEIQ